jgi:hypothetical protein
MASRHGNLTLRPLAVVYFEVWRETQSAVMASELLRLQLRQGQRTLYVYGKAQSPAQCADLKILPAGSTTIHGAWTPLIGISLNGEPLQVEEVHISGLATEPVTVRVEDPVSVQLPDVPPSRVWLTKLRREGSDLLRGKVGPAVSQQAALVSLPETSQIDWRHIWRHVPQRPGEKDAEYLHRFYAAMPQWFQDRYPYKTISNRYYDTGPGRN